MHAIYRHTENAYIHYIHKNESTCDDNDMLTHMSSILASENQHMPFCATIKQEQTRPVSDFPR